MSYCIQKVLPPASPDDATSNVDTIMGNYIGIGTGYFSEEKFLYPK
jgi:hypothetical protein